MQQWYRLWGAPVGFFPAWTDYGWFYGTPQHMSELLGYLLTAGGTAYTFAAADQNGVPVAPIMPPQAGQQSPFPNLPGFQLPGLNLAPVNGGTRSGLQL